MTVRPLVLEFRRDASHLCPQVEDLGANLGSRNARQVEEVIDQLQHTLGRRVYDVGQEDERLILYALLLAEAQREDLERFVHSDSLVSLWPGLRRLLGPHARREWERQLITPASR